MDKIFVKQVNISGEEIVKVGNVVQNDINANLFIISLLKNNGDPVDLTGVTNITFTVKKSNGLIVVDSLGERIVISDAKGGEISITLISTATDVPGEQIATLEVFHGLIRTTSARFYYVVTPELMGEHDPSATDQYPVLTNLIAQVGPISAAEAVRVAAETQRQSAETLRLEAEGTRADAESARLSSETARQSAEVARQAGFTASVQSVVDAIAAIVDIDRAYLQNGYLHVVLSDGTDINTGYVQGADGFNPTITVATSTPTTYVLSITDKNGTITTPNLKGADGTGSGDMHKSVYDINDNGKVDTAENAEKLGGQLPAYYATATALTTEVTARTTGDNNITAATIMPWESTTTYTLNKLAMANGKIYRSLQNSNTNHATTDTAWWGEIGGGSALTFTNVSVPTASFVADTTYPDYPLKAVVTLTGVTAEHFPIVTYGLDDSLSGNFAPICESGAGNITIWAMTAPSVAVSIKSILCVKGV